jgi:hypothetical protein
MKRLPPSLVLPCCLVLFPACDPCAGDKILVGTSNYEAVAECKSISGALHLNELKTIESVELPELTTVEYGLGFSKNESLTTVDLPALTHVNGLYIMDNLTLSTIRVPRLQQSTGGISILNNAALRTLEGIPAPASMRGSLLIQDNVNLCQSEAEAFAASISVGGTVTVKNNGSARSDCG